MCIGPRGGFWYTVAEVAGNTDNLREDHSFLFCMCVCVRVIVVMCLSVCV